MTLLAQAGLMVMAALSPVWPGAIESRPAQQPAVAKIFVDPPAAAPSRRPEAIEPVITASNALLLDLPSGQVLYEKDADKPRPIASLTKLMTAVVVVEHAKGDEVVTVPKLTNSNMESLMGIHEGDQVKVDDLLAGLLLSSGNDAADALAVHVSGSKEDFIKLMNDRAQAIGLTSTHFSTPSGFDKGESFSTARELSTISRAAIAQPRISALTGHKELTVTALNGPQYQLKTTDQLIGGYLPVAGLKTGTTDEAGPCLISLLGGDRRLLAVVLNSPDRFQENKSMLDWALHSHTW